MSTSTIVLSVLHGNDVIALSPLQIALAPYAPDIAHLWAAIWCTTAVVLLGKIFVAWRDTAQLTP